jgi:hypothetical protein
MYPLEGCCYNCLSVIRQDEIFKTSKPQNFKMVIIAYKPLSTDYLTNNVVLGFVEKLIVIQSVNKFLGFKKFRGS